MTRSNSVRSTILILLVLFATFSLVQAAYPPDQTTVYPLYPPYDECDYEIGQYNTTYFYLKNSTTGNYDWLKYNDAGGLILAAIGNLTSGGDIYVRSGNFTINYNQTITIDSNIYLHGAGYSTLLRLADNSACHFVNITGSFNRITNMRFDGNKAHTLTGDWQGIEINDAAGGSPQQNTLDNLWIDNIDYDGVRLYGDASWGGLNYLHNLYIYYAGHHGIYANLNTDNTIEDVVIQDCGQDGCYLWYPQFLKRVHVIYAGHYAFNVAGDHSSLLQCYADTAQQYGFMISGSYNTINEPKTTGNSAEADNTYDDIYISGDYNTVCSSAYLFGTGNGHYARWVIYESSAGDYNQIDNVRCSGALTGQIRTQGINTKVTDSYNGTIWSTGSAGSISSIIFGVYNSTHYYAENSTSGQTYLSSDADVLLNSRISALSGSPNGGEIFVKKGDYSVDATISITVNNVRIFGEGMSTTFELLSANTPVFQVSASYVELHDFRITVNGSAFTTSTALRFITTSSTSLKDCYFSNLIIQTNDATQAGGTGFGVLTTSSGAIYNSKAENIEVYNFNIGLTLDTSSTGWMSANVFDNFYLNTCKYAIIVDGNTNWNQSPHTNTFRDMKVQLGGTTVANTVYVKAYCQYNIFEDLEIYDTTGTQEGVRLDANTNYNTFDNGRFQYFVNNGGIYNVNTNNRLFIEDASDYAFLVFQSGSSYYMKNGKTQSVQYQTTSASSAINSALGNLTVGRLDVQKVFLIGTFNLTTSVLMPNYSMLQGGLLSASADINIISLADPTHALQIYLRDIDIDGNNRMAHHGISFVPFQSLSWNDFEPYRGYYIENVKIRECHGNGLFINHTDATNTTVYIDTLWAHECNLGGVYLEDLTDSTIFRVFAAGMKIYHMTSSQISDSYFGNIDADDSFHCDFAQRCRFNNIKLDSMDHNGMSVDEGTSACVFSNIEAKVDTQLATTLTYSAIYLGECYNNTFSTITITQSATGTLAKILKYGINATQYGGNNIIVGAIAYSQTCFEPLKNWTISTYPTYFVACLNGTTFLMN